MKEVNNNLQKRIEKLEQENKLLQADLSKAQKEKELYEAGLNFKAAAGLKLKDKPNFIFELAANGQIQNFVSIQDQSPSISCLNDFLEENDANTLLNALPKTDSPTESFHFDTTAFHPYKRVQLFVTKQFVETKEKYYLVMGFLTIGKFNEEQKIQLYKETFLNFTEDHLENINKLTAVLGNMLNASVSLYNRLDEDMLISWGQWNTPPDYIPQDKPDGHLCYDVIRGEKDQVLLVRDLQNTAYADSDPNVKPYQLETYIGYPVCTTNDRQVGSICAVFQDDFQPSESDIRVLQTIAYGIGSEEKRLQKEKELKQRGDLLLAINKINALLADDSGETPCQRICQIVGEASKFNSVRVFKNTSKSLADLQIDEVAAWGKGINKSGKIVFHHICKIKNAQKWNKLFLQGEPIAAGSSDFPDKIGTILTDAHIHSFLLAPVIIETHTKYLILVVNSQYQHQWTSIEKEFIKSIAQKISDYTISKRLKSLIVSENERFSAVMNTLSSEVYVSDIDTYKLLYYNKYVAKQIEGAQGSYCYDLVLGQDHPCQACINHLLFDKKGNPKPPTKWRYYNEREKKWFLNENKAIPWVNGKMACLAIGTDITAIVKQEQELKKSKDEIKEKRDFYRTMMDNAPDLIWAKDLEGKYIFANKAMAEKLLIADVKEIKGMTDVFFAKRQRALKPKRKDYHTFGELCADSDKGVIENPTRSYQFDEYGNVQGEFLFLDVLKAPLFNKDKQLIGTVGSGRVVTKEKEIEKELKLSEEKFRSFFEKNRAVMLQIDTQTKKIIDANPAALEYYGYSKEEMLAKYIYDINMLRPDIIDKRVDEVIHSKSKRFEFKHRLANGDIRDVNVFASPIKLGDQLCVFSIVIDITHERQIKEALAKSEQKYRILVESTTDIIARVSLDGHLIYASPNAKNIVGVDVEGKMGQHISKYFSNKNELLQALDILENISKDEEPGTVEAKLKFENRDAVYVEMRYSPIIIDGKVDSIHIIVHDISDRAKAQEALKESEAKYKFLVENTKDVIAQISPMGKLLYVSPNTYEFGGYKPEEEMGNHISNYFASKWELAKALKILRDVVFYKNSGVHEFYYKHKTGKKIPVEVSYSPIIVNGRVKSIHLVIRDVSFRYEAQLKLKESEYKLKEAQSIAKMGHWEYVLNARLIYLSDEAFRIFEKVNNDKPWSVEDYTDYILPADRKRVRRAFINSIKNKEEYHFVHRIQLSGERIRYVSQKAYHVFDDHGRVIRSVGTIQDVTKIKETELALEKSKEQLTELNNKLLLKVKKQLAQSREKDRILLLQSRQATLGEMIGNIAHQWRQPLNEISLLIADMEDAFEYGELTEEYFQKAVKQAKSRISYMSQTIDDFRNFFIEGSDVPDFDPEVAIHKSIQFVERVFAEKKIRLSYHLAKGIRLKGKSNLLSQVILNILNNARDILIERKIAKPEVIINLNDGKDGVKISICDNAGGIDPEIMDKIFDPYFTTKGEKTGIGLGLYMAQTIVSRQMKGVLYAVNKAAGACFIMEF